MKFNLRCCPALLDKARAKTEALEAVQPREPRDAKRERVESEEAGGGMKQDEKEPFKPPYVPELYLGCLEGIEGEEGMSILVSLILTASRHTDKSPDFQLNKVGLVPPER